MSRPWWHSLIIWTSVAAFAVGLLAGAALVVPRTPAVHTDPEHKHAEDSRREWNAGYDAGTTARLHAP